MPPVAIQYPLINGHRYSYASSQFRFNGQLYLGIKSLNYKMSLKAGIVRGTSPNPIGRTVGEAEYTGDCEMLRLEYNNLLRQLGAPVVGFGESPFLITVTFFEIGSEVTIDEIVGARIEEPDASNASGTDASSIKFAFSAMRILHNGAPIVSPRNFGL